MKIKIIVRPRIRIYFKHSCLANQTPITVDILRNMVTYGCHGISWRGGGRQDYKWYI